MATTVARVEDESSIPDYPAFVLADEENRIGSPGAPHRHRLPASRPVGRMEQEGLG